MKILYFIALLIVLSACTRNAGRIDNIKQDTTPHPSQATTVNPGPMNNDPECKTFLPDVVLDYYGFPYTYPYTANPWKNKFLFDDYGYDNPVSQVKCQKGVGENPDYIYCPQMGAYKDVQKADGSGYETKLLYKVDIVFKPTGENADYVESYKGVNKTLSLPTYVIVDYNCEKVP